MKEVLAAYGRETALAGQSALLQQLWAQRTYGRRLQSDAMMVWIRRISADRADSSIHTSSP